MLGGRYYPMGVFTPVYPIWNFEFWIQSELVMVPVNLL